MAANGVPQEAQGGTPSTLKYKGVTKRPDGKWGSDIRDPTSTGWRMWLGTYDTPEEAACAYDAAARTLRPGSRTNFPEPVGEEEMRLAVVLMHVAGVKRKRANKLRKVARRKMEAAEAAAAVRDAVSPVLPPPAPAPEGDASGSQVASPPGGDVVSSVTPPTAPTKAGGAFDFQSVPARAVVSSSVPSPPSPAPAHFPPHFNPTPLNSHSPNAMTPPPAYFPPGFTSPPLYFHFPNAMAPATAFHLAPAPTAPAAATPQIQASLDHCLDSMISTTHAQLYMLLHLRSLPASLVFSAIPTDGSSSFQPPPAAAALNVPAFQPFTAPNTYTAPQPNASAYDWPANSSAGSK
ncbi:hypothetical protein EJB05_06127, partial [Eragrostis curvula]